MSAIAPHTHPREWTRRTDIAAHLEQGHGRHFASMPSLWELVQIHVVLHEDERRTR